MSSSFRCFWAYLLSHCFPIKSEVPDLSPGFCNALAHRTARNEHLEGFELEHASASHEQSDLRLQVRLNA